MPDDMRIPAPDQEGRDAEETRDQVSQLGAPRPGFTGNPDLDSILWTRHNETEGALKFDIVQGQIGGEAFVVRRQLLLPPSDGRDAANEALLGRSFTRVAPSDDVPSDDDPCATLHNLVWVYSYESGTDDDARVQVDDALDFLRGNNMDGGAARHGVTALHVVAKSTDGPAPTSVTVAPFTTEDVELTQAEDQIVVAVIDTGIALDNERLDGWLNEIDRDNNDENVDLLDVFDVKGTPEMPILDFAAGHGTFAAGIIRQVDPRARIVVYRGLDTDGLGSEHDVACAMIRAAEDGAHVISLSLGIEAVDGVIPPGLQAAVDHIRSLPDPPAIVASAGNNGTQEPVYPAALDWVVAVGALQAVDPVSGQSPGGAEWSSHGAWVTCSAVGEGVISTFVKGQEDKERFGDDDVYPEDPERDSWAVWSGTSFAAPQIAAHIAKKCRDDAVTPQAAVDALFPTTNRPADGYGTRVELLKGTRPSQ